MQSPKFSMRVVVSALAIVGACNGPGGGAPGILTPVTDGQSTDLTSDGVAVTDTAGQDAGTDLGTDVATEDTLPVDTPTDATSVCTSGQTRCAGDVVQTCLNNAWNDAVDCLASGTLCVSGSCQPPVCIPNCQGKACGPDDCGGACGTCDSGDICNAFKCEPPTCMPFCESECGQDGCGGVCGVCPGGSSCDTFGACVPGACVPDCEGKDCGPDGCGESCGTCNGDATCGAGVCMPSSPAACMNDTDFGICQTCAGTGNCGENCPDPRAFAQNVATTCVLGCFNDQAPQTCSLGCLLPQTGLTQPCGTCYVDFIICAVNNCLPACLDASSPACIACQQSNCTSGFFECSGYESDCGNGIDDNQNGPVDCGDQSCFYADSCN